MASRSRIDQETANTLVKAVIDHFHRLYDFRSAIDLFDTEMIKYGTGVVRTRQVRMHKFYHDYRGTVAERALGPAVVPLSVRDVYLDDSPVAVMHEGITHAPAHLRCGRKRVSDVINSIRSGGPERGWRQQAVRKLAVERTESPEDDLVEVIEIEGDVMVPRSRSSIFLPNVLVTVAMGRKAKEVIRFRENEWPFISYDVGYYMRQDVDDPYGVSPLMKGQPIQEAATAALNDLMASAALNARPPCFYDRNDATLTAQGGPEIFPGSQTPTDSPNAVEFMERVDLQAMVTAYLALVKQYEDMTAVNDPRRGASVVSHTTATANDMQQARGLARVDDFVQGVEKGALTSILYKEYAIIKKSLTKASPIPVDMGGIEGWVTVHAEDLPDEVSIEVQGSAGVLNERQHLENFVAATNIVMQLAGLSAQLAQTGAVPVNIDFQRLAEEIYRRGGINNAREFLQSPAAGGPAAAGAPAAGPGLSFPPAGVPSNTTADLARIFGT
jgi:hypothetical protein